METTIQPVHKLPMMVRRWVCFLVLSAVVVHGYGTFPRSLPHAVQQHSRLSLVRYGEGVYPLAQHGLFQATSAATSSQPQLTFASPPPCMIYRLPPHPAATNPKDLRASVYVRVRLQVPASDDSSSWCIGVAARHDEQRVWRYDIPPSAQSDVHRRVCAGVHTTTETTREFVFSVQLSLRVGFHVLSAWPIADSDSGKSAPFSLLHAQTSVVIIHAPAPRDSPHAHHLGFEYRESELVAAVRQAHVADSMAGRRTQTAVLAAQFSAQSPHSHLFQGLTTHRFFEEWLHPDLADALVSPSLGNRACCSL